MPQKCQPAAAIFVSQGVRTLAGIPPYRVDIEGAGSKSPRARIIAGVARKGASEMIPAFDPHSRAVWMMMRKIASRDWPSAPGAPPGVAWTLKSLPSRVRFFQPPRRYLLRGNGGMRVGFRPVTCRSDALPFANGSCSSRDRPIESVKRFHKRVESVC